MNHFVDLFSQAFKECQSRIEDTGLFGPGYTDARVITVILNTRSSYQEKVRDYEKSALGWLVDRREIECKYLKSRERPRQLTDRPSTLVFSIHCYSYLLQLTATSTSFPN